MRIDLWLVALMVFMFSVIRGFTVQEIEARVAGGDWATVVWGNHDAVDRQLNALGDSRDLTEWFALWQNTLTQSDISHVWLSNK